MNYIHRNFFRLFFIALIVFTSCTSNRNDKKSYTNEESPVFRVAWMTSWATTGQVVESLIHTDILKEKGINVEFKSFLFGPPMNEAAITGDVDATIVGDMPAIILLARSENWSVVSRTIYFPYGLMVRSDIEANEIIDLRGKTIGVPFGSGPQPTLYRWIEEAGLEIGKDIKVINLLPNEMSEAISSKRVVAIMTWEPTIAVLTASNKARLIKSAKGVGFMCVNNEFLSNNPDVVEKFVEAWKEGLLYTAKNREQTDKWYSEDSRYDLELLKNITVVDSNLFANSIDQINVTLSPEDIQKNQFKADFSFKENLINKNLDIGKRVIK